MTRIKQFSLCLLFLLMAIISVNADEIIDGKQFIKTNFNGDDLSSSTIKNTKFYTVRFRRINLEGALIENTSFRDSDLSLTNFTDAKIYNTKFIDCNLSFADFTNAIIRPDTQFINCNLKKVKGLQKAKQRYLDLQKTNKDNSESTPKESNQPQK